MIGLAKQFIDRVRAGSQTAVDMTQMSKWLVSNTSSPKDRYSPWSFKDHEMQKGICDDPRHHVVARKCSQIGLSELSVRIALALLGIYPGSTAIYTLPTAKFAGKFAKARIDPVIEGSDYLSSQLRSGNDSSELKQLGTSFLYIVGTSGASAPISIPADILVRDEVDFSNQKILSTFFSRLGHAKDGGIIRDFSTPTVEGYGISATFENSSQARNMIRCNSCSEYVAPEFTEHLVIPGYDDAIINLVKDDLDNTRYKVDDAHLVCPNCGTRVSDANLCDPGRRQWVDQYPDREIGGFQIMPWDVPVVNPVPKSVKAINNYESKADWVNFEFGLPYHDAENSIIDAVVDSHTNVEFILPGPMAAQGCVLGSDVGKTSHVFIGKRQGRNIHLLYCERIKQTEEGFLLHRLFELIKMFGVVKAVIDAGPDFTTAMGLIGKCLVNQAYGCYYVRSNKTAFSNIDVNDVEQIVNANKVRCFNHTVKEINGGRVWFPRTPEMATIRAHLASMKKIKSQNSQGDTVSAWVNTGPDHYAHAINYLMIADSLCDHIPQGAVIPTLPHVGKVRFGGAHEAPAVEKLVR